MTLTATVGDVHRMTPDVKRFRLIAENHRFEYDPDQHTTVHVEADGEEEAISDLEETDCDVCGVPEMVVETVELLENAGADADRVYTEGWESDAADE